MKTSTIGLLVVGGLTLAFAISAVALRLGPSVPPRLDPVSQEGRETLNMLDRLDEKERLKEEEKQKRLQEIIDERNSRPPRVNTSPEPELSRDLDSRAPSAPSEIEDRERGEPIPRDRVSGP